MNTETIPTRRPARPSTVASLLSSFQQHDIADAAQCQELAALAPNTAWLLGLQALAAWLAALLVVGAFVLSALATGVYWPFGVLLIAAAMGLFWRYRHASFACQLALALSLAGQSLIAFGSQSDANLSASFLLALALTVPRTSLLHRVVCLLVAIGCVYTQLSLGAYRSGFILLGFALSSLAVLLWLGRRRWAGQPQAGHLSALAHSTTAAGLAILLSHAQIYAQPAYFTSDSIDQYRAYVLGAVLLWLACVGWLTRTLPWHERGTIVGAAILVAALGFGAPGILVCLALVLATFHACQRAWMSATLMCALVFLSIFYYTLQQTLLLKSATLAGVGALLLALGWLARRWQRGYP